MSLERLLVNEYDDELTDKLRNNIDTRSIPFHLSASTGHSIYFIVRTQSETIDLIEKTIQIQVNGQAVEIFLSVVVDPVILLDPSFPREVLNADQHNPDEENIKLIELPFEDPISATTLSIAFPISKQHFERIKLGCLQCHGFNASDNRPRCHNRRRRVGCAAAVWCYHHVEQKHWYTEYIEGMLPPPDFEIPLWWIS